MQRTAISLAAAIAVAGFVPVALAQSTTSIQRAPTAGAPPPNSGPVDYKGFVRVIDGDTAEIYINGNQVGIGLIGIKAPMGNTPCGQEAIAFKKQLVIGGLFLKEDRNISFDSRKRRMYYAYTRDGRSVAKELVQAGEVDADGTGDEANDLQNLEDEAARSQRGCRHRQSGAGNAALPASAGATTSGVANGQAEVASSPDLRQEPRAALSAPAAAITSGGFTESVVAAGFSSPTNFTFLPDGRILVAEKHGVVKVVKGGAVLPTPVIDISAKVNDYWDHGLIGMAADPAFATNGFIYLLYTYENDATQYSGSKTARLSRFTMSGDMASLATEQVILGTSVGSSCNNFAAGTDCLSSENPSHSIGNIKFDPAGNIFVTAGDGASFNVVDDDALRTQNLDLLAGKLLHVTPAGAGLPANPFWNGTAAANRSKIWSYGLRNSFRFSLQPVTNTPFMGDVGWSTWERLLVGTAGSNQGWPCYEGALQQPGYAVKPLCQSLYSQTPPPVKAPVYTYNHNGGSAAITAGVFYTGTTYPSKYQGAYFFGDYPQSWIRYARIDNSGNLTSGPFDFLYNAGGPVAIEMGADQNLYYLSIVTGELRRVTFVGPDTISPTVVSTTPANGATGQPNHLNILATFSELVDPATITGTTFSMIQQTSGASVAALVSYDGGSQTATLQPNTDLVPGATYVATIRGGPAGVNDLAGNALAADRVWTFTTSALPPPPNGVSYLSDLSWTFMSNGWGPVEKDMSNGEQLAGDGRPLSIRGAKFAKGLGTHGPSDVRYNLGGACSSFVATVGIDDEVAPNGAVLFQVFTDGLKIFDSGTVSGTSAALPLNINVTGKIQLQLIVADAGFGFSNAHADWANAQVTCGAGSGPVVTSVSPAEGSIGAPLTGPMTATFTGTVNTTTITTSTFFVSLAGPVTPLPATVSFNAATNTATLQPSVALQSGATYTATVKGGASGVKDTSGNPMSADKTWNFSTGTAPPPGTSYLSDLTWTSMTNGWGPVEKDTSNGEQAAGDGRTISIRGVTFAKGLGAHGPSDVRYNLSGACSAFAASVGIDDEVAPNGSVLFQVWADGVKLWDNGGAAINGTMAAVPVSVSLTGRTQLQLVIADAGTGFSNAHGDWAGARITCGGAGPPVPTITSPSSSLLWKVGDVINYAGSAVDSGGNAVPASGLAWQIILHHCPGGVCHIHPFTTSTGASGSFTAPDHGDQCFFEIVLTATDSGGQQATQSLTIQPKTIQLTLTTNPAGLQVVYGGVAGTAPFVQNPIVGSTHTISTPTPQGSNTFVSWSDGGAASHNVVAVATDIVYTATFSGAPLISAVTVNNLSPTSVSISWTTDQPADTQVDYGASATYGLSSPLNSALVTSHSVTLTGLTAASLYHYRVDSRNASGVLSQSPDATFTTTSGTGPTVTSFTPSRGANGIALTSAVTATFSTAMNATTISGAFSLVKQGTTTALAATVTYNATTRVATLHPTSPLLPATTYTATVKGGTAGVKDTSGNPMTADVTWNFTTRTGPPSGTSFLSDLTWTSATNGWGPVEKDMSNGEKAAGDGRTISIRGVTFAKGLGTHAPSDISYNLSGACSSFTASVGVDDEVAPQGSVVFQVWTDGAKVYDSGIATGTVAAKAVSVTITGKTQLRLVVADDGDGLSNDHADWANAKIVCQ